jgi:hypothetical protein
VTALHRRSHCHTARHRTIDRDATLPGIASGDGIALGTQCGIGA